MEHQDNLLNVVSSLYRWRKPILGVTFLVAIGTAAISFAFLDNYYKSTTTFYAASPDLFKPEQVFGTSNKDMEYYGTENDVDRILTIAQSGELYEYLIKRFDLYRHYKIDTSSEKAPFKVREALEKLYEAKKTKFNAIELSVEDKDRRLASEMANAARDKIDEIAQRLVRQSQWTLLKAYESSFLEKEKLLKGMGDTLYQLRESYGVIDPDKQTEVVTGAAVTAENNYVRSKAKFDILKQSSSVSKDTLIQAEANVVGYNEELKRSVELLKKYNLGFNSVSVMKEMYERERDQMSKDKQRYLQMMIAYNTKISALHLVESAAVPIEKSRPKRSIIVLSALIIALVLMIFAVLLIENYRNVNWNEVLDQSSPNGETKPNPSEKRSSIGFFKKN